MGQHPIKRKKKRGGKPRNMTRRLQKIRLKLIRIAPFCSYCNIRITFQTSTLDHIISKARGGTNAQTNLTLCCISCNHAKGNRTPQEFREFMRKKKNVRP